MTVKKATPESEVQERDALQPVAATAIAGMLENGFLRSMDCSYALKMCNRKASDLFSHNLKLNRSRAFLF